MTIQWKKLLINQCKTKHSKLFYFLPRIVNFKSDVKPLNSSMQVYIMPFHVNRAPIKQRFFLLYIIPPIYNSFYYMSNFKKKRHHVIAYVHTHLSLYFHSFPFFFFRGIAFYEKETYIMQRSRYLWSNSTCVIKIDD